MSLLSGNIFTPRTSTDINSNSAAADLNAAVSDANKKALMDMINNLSAGDTILGKVISQSGKNISIITQQGVTINAKNSAQITFDKGSTILFEVQKASGKDISIRPLYQNTSIQNTAELALRQAGIPINERSLEMTGRNMEYGNPIDRNSLIDSYKDVALYPEASVKSIVDLQKMDMPVTPENLRQYQAYVNMENSVTEAFDHIADTLADDFVMSLVNEDGIVNPDASNTLTQLLDLFEKSENAPAGLIDNNELINITDMAKESGLLFENTEKLINSKENFSPEEVLKNILQDIDNPVPYVLPEPEQQPQDTVPSLLDLLNKQDGLNKQPETLPESIDFNAAQALADFTGKEVINDIIKKVFNSRWSVDSSKLADKNEISGLYDRLYNETRQILDILNQTQNKGEAAKEAVTNLKENIEFMHDLNQYVPYIQIPFHTEGNQRNSELYVYKNKKNLAEDNSELTAFIHLDMENLGPTDVFVKLRDQKVTTNFTVKDEDTLLFIENHLDLLERRIGQKGYSFDASVSKKKSEKSPMEQMLSQNEQHFVLQETSFDARV